MTTRHGRRREVAVVTICLSALFVVAFGAVATGTTTTAGTQEEANLSVQNLTAPDEVELGSNYTVSADVVNQDGEQEFARVSYRIAGNVIESEPVRIPGGESETVQFNVKESDTGGLPPGTYPHGVYVDGGEAIANLTLTEAEETVSPEEAPEEEETPTPEETEEAPDEETATPEEEATPTPELSAVDVSFENQTSNGTAVTVGSVTVPEGGFVVVHDESLIDGVVVDSMLGESDYLEAGTQENVTIRLDEPMNESQRLVAVVYRDENDNREYDFATSNRTVDGPYTEPDSREAVNDIAFVEVEDDQEE